MLPRSDLVAVSSELPLTASAPLANDPTQPCEIPPECAATARGAARTERDRLEMLVPATARASTRS